MVVQNSGEEASTLAKTIAGLENHFHLFVFSPARSIHPIDPSEKYSIEALTMTNCFFKKRKRKK